MPPSVEPTVIRSPYDGRVLGEVPAHTPADVDAAVARAARALGEQPLPVWRRVEILERAADALSGRHAEFATTIADEAAKPIRTARQEVDRAISTIRFSAAEARRLTGEMVALDATAQGADKLGFTMRLPIGVVGAIAPFNFPLNLVAHKLAPAVAAGCPVVLKPAEQTPFSALALADVFQAAGLPQDYLQVVTGEGATVGAAIVDHPAVAFVSFTGSPEVGWQIRSRAPRKRVALELGNNSPLIVEADSDWAAAAAKTAVAGFSHAGQSCVSTQRVYVHRSVHDAFVEALVGHVERLVVGDPLAESTDVSALISADARDRVVTWIEEASAQGADVRTGGTLTDHGVLRPTVLTGVRPGMRVSDCEVFGPVVGVAAYDTIDAAIELANTTEYGLQAGVFTRDLGTALRVARELDFGGVLVNEVPTWRADQQPYGGVRESGNTREGPAYTIREMTELRMVVLGA